MPSRPHLRLVVASLILAATGETAALAQAPTSPRPASRRPFAAAETPHKPERPRLFDVGHIKGALTLDGARATVGGTVTLTVAPLHPDLATIDLDCGTKLKVAGVKAGQADCTFEHEGERLRIALDKARPEGEAFDLAVAYAGSPEKGIYFVPPDGDGPDAKAPAFIWTQGAPEDTRDWLPCFDYPNDRATSEMVVTVARPLSVLSNGTLVETVENPDGTRTFHWAMQTPHVSYLVSLAAADFAVYEDQAGDLPLTYWVERRFDEATARRAMGNTPKMIAYFNNKIGTKYPYPKYAQVCVPDFTFGGMENISATTLNDNILRDKASYLERDSDGLVSHELAHQWFGDLVTCRDWADIWLNEGFASYFDQLYAEHDLGDDAFRLGMAGEWRTYLASDGQYRRPIVEDRYDNTIDLFDRVTYQKGACILHALRGLIGDEAWWRGIRKYVADNAGKVVRTEDFRLAMESASGRDLAWFFDQWTAKGGHPELKVRWRYEPEDSTVRVAVEQTQTVDPVTPLFRLPTTIELTDESGMRPTPVVVDGRSHEFVIPATTRPKMVRIDPKNWWPKTVDFDKPAEEWEYQLAHDPTLPGRHEAARALAAKGGEAADKALVAAWPNEKYPPSRAVLVGLLSPSKEPHRAALLAAARDGDARVRVAALNLLWATKLDPASEAVFRATLENADEAYGARVAALRGLVHGKVADKDALLAKALLTRSDSEAIASAALDQLVAVRGESQKRDPGARDAAVAASRPGHPAALRARAATALGGMARDDASAADALLDLVDDPSRAVRLRAADALASAHVTKALPRLEARLATERPPTRERFERAVRSLKTPGGGGGRRGRGPGAAAPPAGNASSIAELEGKAADLDLQAKELRNQADALKLKDERAKLGTPAGNR